VTRLRIGKDGFTLPVELVTSTLNYSCAQAQRQELYRIGAG